jgi:hypothetical protein
MIRAMIPQQIDKPCLFYVKQGDMSFRGDWSMLMQDNRPKPTYNMARIFNSLRGNWVSLSGGSDDVCAVAAMDEDQRRLQVVLVNFRFRHATGRQVKLNIDKLPGSFADGGWREWIIDSQHSNVFANADRCELEMTASGKFKDIEKGAFYYERKLPANSIVLLELVANLESE